MADIVDTKKWLWVPDEHEGFIAATLKEKQGLGDNVVLLLTNGNELVMDINDTSKMNPPKFEKIEDMACLTYLNEASILHNLRQRYYSSLIYTYSGLFCVALNPYCKLPIYTNKVVDMYKGRRKTEMPPHIYSISDNAYRDMLQDHENQSILITGESGAGKTENTKKVIQYFAFVAPGASTGRLVEEKKKTLEDQIIQANPVLEAFGNAKTIRNDNSSRFGKFIRIHFGNQGKIAGADIEYYLLEKSRVISQQPGERSYHIFYQLLAGADQEMLNSLLLSRQVKSNHFIENGEVAVDNVDDADEFNATREAMITLGMDSDEIMGLFKTLAGILHFGNIEVKQRPRDEWATIPTTTAAEKVSHLLGINSVDLIKSLIKPRIRVGTEYVQQGRNMEQCIYSIGALSKTLYERMFSWLVKRVNKTLDTKARKNFFIGVLDIAGFEIFTLNSFEQLCINYTNERLQQFFNHHMFVQEQEEYRKEGINWDFIDFGLDLQSTIDLIEKPMGVLSLLDEESLFPKATDSTFVEKLTKTHEGKSVSFSKPDFKSKGSVIHFELAHYAGVVGYTVIGWLNKNKDPLNHSVVEHLRKSTDPFIAGLWSDYQSTEKDTKRKKGSQFVTMAQLHKTSLGNLMTTLRNTTPHFVRCIIPNELKKPGTIDAELVLQQLRCNGVLEGIRICRKGFPNRLIYQEFRQRYAILAPKAIPAGFMDARKACELLLSCLTLEESEYRLGSSKVFFRAGVLGRLEDMRDDRLGQVLTQFQAYARGFCMRRTYQKLQDKKLALAVLQRNIRKYLFLRNWKWWKIFTKVKPLLNVARGEDELRKMEEEVAMLKEKILKEEQFRKEMNEQQASFLTENKELFLQLQKEQDQYNEAEENVQHLMTKKGELESNIQELSERLDEEVENNSNISANHRKLEAEISHLLENIEDMNQQISAMAQEKSQRERDCQNMKGELEKVNANVGRAHKEKKALDERIEELANNLQGEEDKANRLSKAKVKLENAITEVNEELEREKKLRGDMERVKRKLDADLKAVQDTIDSLNSSKMELEKYVKSKEKEISELQQTNEDNGLEIASLQKKVRELEAIVREMGEDLENEINARNKLEKQKNNLLRDLENLQIELEEQGGATASQIDKNHKHEAELIQLHVNLTTQEEEHETMLADLRKKQANAVVELEGKMATLQKTKGKLEKDVHRINADLIDTRTQLEDNEKAKSTLSRKLAQVEEHLGEASARIAEFEIAVSVLQSSKSKLQCEKNDIVTQLEEAQDKNGSLSKINANISTKFDETKSELEMEIAIKLDAQSKLRSTLADVTQLQELLEEEQEAKSMLSKDLAASKSDAAMWKTKMEGEASMRIEELEDTKRKLQNKLNAADDAYMELKTKHSSLDKVKNRMTAELEDLHFDLEKEHNKSQSMEKKQKHNDKQITDWMSKYDSKEAELEQSKKELHMSGTELLKMRNHHENLEEALAASHKEKKYLQVVLIDLEKQLNEGGLSVHELEKTKNMLESEKEELAVALEESETQLESEQARLLCVQLELTQSKNEMERHMKEVNAEIESAKKNQQRQLVAMQQAFDEEVKAKNEQAKQRKLLGGEINQMQSHAEEVGKALNDSLKKHKNCLGQLKELNSLYELEQKLHEEQREISLKAEKKANDLNLEVEDVKIQLEQLQRLYRACDGEKAEAGECVQELQTSTSVLQTAKRKSEQCLANLQEEYDELETEAQENRDKLKKMAEQNGHLQSEMTVDKNKILVLQKAKNSLELQMKELSSHLDTDIANAAKDAKKDAAKIQAKILVLENEVITEAKAKSDAQRAMKKSDSKVKELQRQLEVEKSSSQYFQDQINQLNGKVRSLRRDKEEAETEAEGLLKKLKLAKAETDEAEETCLILQGQVSKLRAAARRKPSSDPADADDP